MLASFDRPKERNEMLFDDALLAAHLLLADLAGRAPLSLVIDVTLGDHAEGVLSRKWLSVRERFLDLADSGSGLLSLLASLGDGRAAVLLSAFPKLVDVGNPKTRPGVALIDPSRARVCLGIDFLS